MLLIDANPLQSEHRLRGYNGPMNHEHARSTGEARVETLIEALLSYQPKAIYLFGSHAAGKAHEQSDIDLVIIKVTHQPFFQRLQDVAALVPLNSGPVDILVYTPEEFAEMLERGNAFAEMISKEARLVYGTAA